MLTKREMIRYSNGSFRMYGMGCILFTSNITVEYRANIVVEYRARITYRANNILLLLTLKNIKN